MNNMEFFIMDSTLKVIMMFLVFVVTSIIFFTYHRYSYWRRKGIPGPRPIFPLGTLVYYLGDESIAENDQRLAKQYGKLVGLFDAMRPILLVSDAEVIKEVLISKFSSIMDNNQFAYHEKFNESLIFQGGEKWKRLRMTAQPAFMPSKVKNMHETIDGCLKTLSDYLDKCIASDKNDLNALEELTTPFALDVVARTAFASEFDTYPGENKSPQSKEFVRQFFNFTMNLSQLRYLAVLLLPHSVCKFLSINPFDPEATLYVADLCKAMVSKHEEDMKKIPDFDSRKPGNFMDTLLQVKGLTPLQIETLVYLIYMAGSDTSSTHLAWLMCMCAIHPEVQEKMRKEVSEVTNVDTLMSLPYLEAVMKETMRMFPPVIHFNRVVSRDVTLESCGLHLKKGTAIRFPVYHLGRNEEYFTDPETFNPDRFLPENEGSINPHCFVPFVGGPRVCLGKHFATNNTKLFMSFFLKRYRVKASPRLTVPIQYGHKVLLLKPKDPFVLIEKL